MKSSREIKIATRTSKLALWQAYAVKTKLEKLGHTGEIVPVETTGDVQLQQPIYAFGITGVFTKQLDTALINKHADIAVHSLKDVPTHLAENLTIAAVLERGPVEDVLLVKKENFVKNTSGNGTVATSSLRRRAQWLSKYPNHTIVPIRGNVQTRLRKFEEDKNIDGVIFAKAGLHRLDLLPENAVTLDWMLPAPAQGIIGIVCRADDKEIIEALKQINHHETFIAGSIERQFLQTLMGGCSVPISALAKMTDGKISLTGGLHSFDGSESYFVNEDIELADWENAGRNSANNLLNQKGVSELLEIIRNKNWNEEGAVDQDFSDETIAYGSTLNLEIQCRDFIDITEMPFDDTILMKGDFDSVAFTSSYAVKAIVKNEGYKDLLKKKTIFSLSGRTADVLAKAGIKVIAAADDAGALADKIIEMKLTKSILHPGGNLTLERLNLKMNKAKITYHSLTVYNTTLNNLKLEDGYNYDAVMFYSPSGLKSFFHSNKLAAQTVACCIGETTGKALRERHQHSHVIIPVIPSPESMLEAIANHFKKSNAGA